MNRRGWAAGLLVAFVTACSSGPDPEGTTGPALDEYPTHAPSTETLMARPTIDPESPYRTTPGEFALQLKACLADRGFQVEIDPYDFHLTGQFGGEDAVKALQTAVADCRTSIDASRNDPPPPLTEEQLRALYRYRVAEAECLEAAGHATAVVPPEQVFVDGGGQWDARWGLEDVDIPRSITRACAQVDGRPGFLDW